jgi:hypothetical protein
MTFLSVQKQIVVNHNNALALHLNAWTVPEVPITERTAL